MALKINEPARLPAEVRVFNAFQSDRPLTRSHVRKCLNGAVKRLNNELSTICQTTIIVDEATRDLPGSPDIVNAIYDKIDKAQAVVADVTIVSEADKDNPLGSLWLGIKLAASRWWHGRPRERRSYPNPNALAEAFYGAARHKWDRIIMVMDTWHGKPENLPFDINHRRVATFVCPVCDDAAALAEEKFNLEQLFYTAIRAILQDLASPAPLPPDASAELKRQRDHDTLIRVLSAMDSRAFDQFAESAQEGVLLNAIRVYWFGFEAVVTSSRFHLHDSSIRDEIFATRRHLDRAMDIAGNLFVYSSKHPMLTPVQFNPDSFFDDEQAKDEFSREAQEARAHYRKALTLIQEKFPEIDIAKTDAQARSDNAEYFK